MLVVEAVMIFGVGGRTSVLTHMHTPPTMTHYGRKKISRSLQFWDLTILLFPSRRHFLGSTSLLNTDACNFASSCSCSPSPLPIVCSLFSHTEFPGLAHAVFPLRIEMCGSVLCWANLWVLHCGCIRTGLGSIKFVPSVVCIHFSQWPRLWKRTAGFPVYVGNVAITFQNCGVRLLILFPLLPALNGLLISPYWNCVSCCVLGML